MFTDNIEYTSSCSSLWWICWEGGANHSTQTFVNIQMMTEAVEKKKKVFTLQKDEITFRNVIYSNGTAIMQKCCRSAARSVFFLFFSFSIFLFNGIWTRPHAYSPQNIYLYSSRAWLIPALLEMVKIFNPFLFVCSCWYSAQNLNYLSNFIVNLFIYYAANV